MKKKTGIYSIRNKKNGKLYIGSSVDVKKRFREHKRLLNLNKHHNAHLQSAWNKHQRCSFQFRIIEITTNKNLIKREQYWIDQYDFKNLYNINPVAGIPHYSILQISRRISKALTGKPRPAGRILTEEHKRRISEAKKGNTHCLGRKLSKETKRKIGKASKGHKYNLGRYHTEETKKKISNTKRRQRDVQEKETRKKL